MRAQPVLQEGQVRLAQQVSLVQQQHVGFFELPGIEVGHVVRRRSEGCPPDETQQARTVELEDRYVILASFAEAARSAYLNRGAKPVAGAKGKAAAKPPNISVLA